MTDDVVSLAKLVARQARLISLISTQLADHACIIRQTLATCQKCKATPATVKHIEASIVLCDRCVAESVVSSARMYVEQFSENPNDEFNNVVRASMMNEKHWVDVPEADKIRRLNDYVTIIKELDVSDEKVQ